MSSKVGVRLVRAGAHSCVECRKSKIRCTWPEDTIVTSCNPCSVKKRTCVPQLTQAPKSVKKGTKRRLSQIEDEITSLKNLLQDQSTSNTARGPESVVDGPRTKDADLKEVEPSYLRALFSQDGVGSDRSRKNDTSQQEIERGRAILLPFVPSQDELSKISRYASQWMSLYYTLFPSFTAIRTEEQLLVNFQTITRAHPVFMAHWLLSEAISALQAQVEHVCGQRLPEYVDNLVHAVNSSIINETDLICTPEGLETALLSIRLSLGRTNIRQTWLNFRKIIATAELIDLPHTSDPKAKAIWEAICATDRHFGMMLSLPPATTRYEFPETPLLHGKEISTQEYNYHLANVCGIIFEIDESFAHGKLSSDSYELVLRADRILRHLSEFMQDIGLASLVVRFWHHYILARVHLRPTMLRSPEYAYSRQTCIQACRDALQAFPKFRPLIPRGFFICRVVDIQAFTAAAILLLMEGPYQDIEIIDNLVDCLVQCTGQAGSDFAKLAVDAISILRGQNAGQGDQPTMVQIPMLGKIVLKTVPSTGSANDLSIPEDGLSGLETFDHTSCSLIFGDDDWLTNPNMTF